MIINNAAKHKEPRDASYFYSALSYTQRHVYLCGLSLIQSYLSKIYFWKFLNQGDTSRGCYVWLHSLYTAPVRGSLLQI